MRYRNLFLTLHVLLEENVSLTINFSGQKLLVTIITNLDTNLLTIMDKKYNGSLDWFFKT